MKRYTPEELHVRLIFLVGASLAAAFLLMVFSILYALIFVSQPMTQAPNDKDFIETLKTLSIFLTGTLSGLVGASAMKKSTTTRQKPKVPTESKQDVNANDETIGP